MTTGLTCKNIAPHVIKKLFCFVFFWSASFFIHLGKLVCCVNLYSVSFGVCSTVGENPRAMSLQIERLCWAHLLLLRPVKKTVYRILKMVSRAVFNLIFSNKYRKTLYNDEKQVCCHTMFMWTDKNHQYWMTQWCWGIPHASAHSKVDYSINSL